MRCGFQLNRRLAGGADTAAVRVEVEGGEGRVGDRQSHFFRLAAILLLTLDDVMNVLFDEDSVPKSIDEDQRRHKKP
jgi:hypothetical protein